MMQSHIPVAPECGNHRHPAGLEKPSHFAQGTSIIIDMLDHVGRGDAIGKPIGERQVDARSSFNSLRAKTTPRDGQGLLVIVHSNCRAILRRPRHKRPVLAPLSTSSLSVASTP
jgi:hypothetical protein